MVNHMIHSKRDGVALDIHALPNAKVAGIVGVHGDRLKVGIRQPPQDGQANRELIEILAKALGVAKSSITLSRGASSRQKTVEIFGMTEDELRSHLEKFVGVD